MDLITTPSLQSVQNAFEMNEDAICDLPPSKLGSQEYWEELYRRELENFKENPEDSGEVWFGRSVETRVIKLICENFPKDTRILDLGCGNGHFLHRLNLSGFSRLHGVDYSHAAVELAKQLYPDASFTQLDIFTCGFFDNFDLIHDKGTFDAISLRGDQNSVSLANAYSKFILDCCNENSSFLITSCNWTRDELIKLFNDKFSVDLNVEIEHSSFCFGGSKGQTVSSVLFNPRKTK